jgi:hypothetical protein
LLKIHSPKFFRHPRQSPPLAESLWPSISAIPALIGYQAVQYLLPDALLVLGGDALLPSFLNGGEPECILIPRRSASAFDSTFAWNACHLVPRISHFSFILSEGFSFVQCEKIRTSFGQPQKRREHADFYRNTVLSIMRSCRVRESLPICTCSFIVGCASEAPNVKVRGAPALMSDEREPVCGASP